LSYGTATSVVFAAGLVILPGPTLTGFAMSAGQNAVGQYVATDTVDLHQVFVAGVIGGACGVGGVIGGMIQGRAALGITQFATKAFGANAANICRIAVPVFSGLWMALHDDFRFSLMSRADAIPLVTMNATLTTSKRQRVRPVL